ncbi:hypothetical protein FNV43_RR12482 [Rhamnella rubrinervis]|uniref:Uncharacterized protein n=1 Tax=Rhamnella rubrinervis TaxID=2594499 RepID=A0A8K0H8B3_9ROSA|nr:hypothetical protein FNV43_RR12482 [Rhamnella rubrinervis]
MHVVELFEFHLPSLPLLPLKSVLSNRSTIPAGQGSNFILEDGRSLMHCVKVTLKENKINTLKYDPFIYDNKCSVCHCDRDEEEEVLIMCDWCPSAFHPTCVGLNEVPYQNHNYNWTCPSCSCGICGNGRKHRLVFCHHCPMKYHTGCITKDGKKKINKFCSKGCVQIYRGLRNIRRGKPIPVAGGNNNLTWTLLKLTGSKRTDIFKKAENYKNLERALYVMRECFDYNQKQRIVIEDVIMGGGALKFKKFYTAVLKSGDELITVATVRIHGEKLAEIALVATRSQYRRLGMCRALINELEKQLSDLGVERLTVPLPAIPSDLHTCFSSLGFSKMTLYERSRLLKYTLLDLPDTVMWHKFLKGFFFKFKPVQ